MKKFLLLILLLLFANGCIDDPKDKNISFETNEISVEIIGNTTLPIILKNINNNEIEYVVEDQNVVLIEEGIVIPLEIGSTYVTAKYKLDNSISARILVNVTPELPKLRLPETITIGGFSKLTITNFSNNNLFTWEVNDNSIVTIDESYTLYALKVGKTTVTVTHKEDSSITITKEIEVMEENPVLFASNLRLQPNDQVKLEILNLGERTNKDYIWELSDKSLATLDDNYVLTVKKEGSLEVTVTLIEDPRYTSTITIEIGLAIINPNGEVKQGPLYLKAENIEAKVKAGESIKIEIVGGKDNYNYRWFSSDSTVVAATDQGVIWGIKEGQSTIMVYSKTDNQVKGYITVTVFGTPNVDYVQRLVDAALSQKGYTAGYNKKNKFGDWFMYDNVDWCAIFVSWAANQAGIGLDVVHKYSLVSDGVEWYQERGVYKSRSEYIPKKGDIIFFQSGGRPSHVGIVVSVDANRVYTIEGNTSNGVYERNYKLTDTYILGYAAPLYPEYNPNL